MTGGQIICGGRYLLTTDPPPPGPPSLLKVRNSRVFARADCHFALNFKGFWPFFALAVKFLIFALRRESLTCVTPLDVASGPAPFYRTRHNPCKK